jgi:cell wall-associated NlpC family hydrolase
MNFCKSLSVVLFLFLSGVVFSGNAFSQGRERIVQSSPPNSQQQIAHLIQNTDKQDLPEKYQRPQTTLTNRIIIAPEYQPLVKKTVSSQPVNTVAAAATSANDYASRNSYAALFSARLLNSIQTKIGKPYVFGSSGPSSYDCSGFVWSVFQDTGFYFERSSARTIWQNAEPVQDEDRFQPGTLVFLNGLAHIGIVADENGFYHASTSRGVMYSRFDGYWKNRIVGFRRMNINNQVASIK